MAIARQHQTDVGSSATAITGTQYPGWMLYNNGSATVYIGDSNVTTGNGWPIEPQDIFSPSEIAHKSLRGIEGDQMYGIVGSGTQDVRVLIPGRVNK